MRFSLVFVAVLALALWADDGECWGRRRRRRRRRSGGRWGISNGGVTYTFKNGATVTGHGSLSNGGSVGVKVSIPFGRKRRSIKDQDDQTERKIESHATEEPQMTQPTAVPVSDVSKVKVEEISEIPAQEERELPVPQDRERDDNCEDCLDIQPFKINDKAVENATIENNDFVMVVKFVEENMSAKKLEAKIKFEVVDVVKSPIENVKEGETFTLNAEMAKCPCLSSLNPGYYVVTGTVNDQRQLVLSNVLMEFER